MGGPTVTLDDRMRNFRLASRGLYNDYFHMDVVRGLEDLSIVACRFRTIEAALFDVLVAKPSGLSAVEYRDTQPEINVVPLDRGEIPVLVNREVDSGYWDHPIQMLHQSATVKFIQFFDWDERFPRDHHYVRARISNWPGEDSLNGRQVLIESYYVEFVVDQS